LFSLLAGARCELLMLLYQHQTFVLVGITVSHVLIKWMVHSIEWRNEAKCHLGLITKMPPFSPLKFGLQYFEMKKIVVRH